MFKTLLTRIFLLLRFIKPFYLNKIVVLLLRRDFTTIKSFFETHHHTYYRLFTEPPDLLASLSDIDTQSHVFLIIDHDMGGGANSYRNQVISEQLDQGQLVALYYENHFQGIVELYSKNHKKQFCVKSLNELEEFLSRFRISEIFYNNSVFYQLPLEIPKFLTHLKLRTNAKLTLAVHDFNMLCPSYNLLNNKNIFCNLPDSKQCDNCLPNNINKPINSKVSNSQWRLIWKDVIGKADAILCFSNSSKDLFLKVYPDAQNKMSINSYSMNYFKSKPIVVDYNKPLTIGIVGIIGRNKGAEIVNKLATVIRQKNIQARIIIIGNINGTFITNSIKATGAYTNSTLPDLLKQHQVNMVFFPSIWPETFSYVISELMLLQMPICAFNLGAQGEKVSTYSKGVVVHPYNIGEALDAMLDLFKRMKKES